MLNRGLFCSFDCLMDLSPSVCQSRTVATPRHPVSAKAPRTTDHATTHHHHTANSAWSNHFCCPHHHNDPCFQAPATYPPIAAGSIMSQPLCIDPRRLCSVDKLSDREMLNRGLSCSFVCLMDLSSSVCQSRAVATSRHPVSAKATRRDAMQARGHRGSS